MSSPESKNTPQSDAPIPDREDEPADLSAPQDQPVGDPAPVSDADSAADAPREENGSGHEHSHHRHHHHHHHHHHHTESTPSDDAQTELVPPIGSEDRVSPRRMESADDPESTEGYYFPDPEVLHSDRSTVHSGSTKMLTDEEIEKEESDFVFRSLGKPHKYRHLSAEVKRNLFPSGKKPRKSAKEKHRGKKMPLWLRIVIITLCVLLGLAAALGATYLILREIGRNKMHDYDNIDIVSPTTEESGDEMIEVIDSGRTVMYNGKKYLFNEDVVCICVVGVDHDISNDYVQSMGDAVNLIAFDTDTGKLTVIGVSRDTMTDVGIYSPAGKYVDTSLMQITYAYSYGNDSIPGGANTALALSRLFYGLPVNHYFALNMNALKDLTDAIGGVTLTLSTDFESAVYRRKLWAGETVTLYGRDAEVYVRTRNLYQLDSNVDRMKRQQEFIRAFLSQVIPAVKKDLSLVTELYGIIEVNSDSNLDLTKIVYLASQLVSKMDSVSDISYLSLSGEVVKGGEHAQFYADEESILEMMLKVFYTPVE